MYYDELKDLVGKKVKEIYINSEYLRFVTDGGNFTYRVTGDCCSHSYFYDFYGVKKLLDNGPIKEVKGVELLPSDLVAEGNSGELKVYGYALVTEDSYYGDVTSVFSFRNASNGYYGGSIEKVEDKEVGKLLTEDIAEIKSE